MYPENETVWTNAKFRLNYIFEIHLTILKLHVEMIIL